MTQLPRQTTPYTCGAACLAAVGRMLGYTFDEMSIAEACNAKPFIGIENADLEAWAKEHLPVAKNPGSFPSIWNIRNPISGVGHYVVALGVRENRVRYYDPLFARVQEFDVADIDWRSGCGNHLNWRLDFDADQSFYDTPWIGEPFLGTPAGQPVPEFVLASLTRYLDNHTPRISRPCPQGGACTCAPSERCVSR